VSSRYRTLISFSGEDSDVVNFADAFQEKDLDVKNLIFEGEDRNNKIKSENKVIKDKKQTKLRAAIPNNLSFTIAISRRQGSKGAHNNTKKYDLRRLAKKTK